MNDQGRLIYACEGYYHLFFGNRGYVLKTGDYTPMLPMYEVKRLLNTGFFVADDGTWNKLTDNGKNAAKIENMFVGKRIFILAGGPSVKKHDLSKLKNEYVIAVNHSFDYYPNANAVIFVDSEYAKMNYSRLENYTGLIFASFRCQDTLSKISPKKNVYFFPQNNSRIGRTLNEGLYSGRLTGLCAINLALIMGASEIYLLGYDMNYEGGHHWYGTAYEKQNTYAEDNYKRKLQYFDIYKKYSDRIFNCSPTSSIKIFKYKEYDEIFDSKPVMKKTVIEKKTQSRYPTYPTSNYTKLKSIENSLCGKRIFVLGSGPSLKGFDLNRLDNEETIAVNHTLEYYPKAKYHVAGDPRVFQYVKHIYDNGFNGKAFLSYHTDVGDYETKDNIYIFAKNWDNVTTTIDDGLYSDFNSGMEAVNLALIMGSLRIYLLGIDFCADGEDYYFYGKPKWFGTSVKSAESLFKARLQYWDKFKPYRDRIFNCSKISKVKVFDYIDIEDVLNGKDGVMA